MAISITRYVDIVSGVGGASSVKQRELIGRIFTTSDLVPYGSLVEVTSAADALALFGASSDEYKRAAMYFGFISKSITQAKKLGYARWANVALKPYIYGGKCDQVVANWAAITNGDFTLTMGGNTAHISGLDFSGVVSLAAVAGVIQTAIKAVTDPQFAAASVTYDAVRNGFKLIGGVAEAADISVAAGTVHNILGMMGFAGVPGIITSPGALAAEPVEDVSLSAQSSDNFGSFLFVDKLAIDQHEANAAWNKAQNVKYQYMVPVTAADSTAWSTALIGCGGTAMTLVADPNTEYDEMIPMIILAATDYSRRQASQNYMFQQVSGVSAKVTTNTEADLYDPERINYYGVTQTAGQNLAFYQRGYLCGVSTDPQQMGVYANEQWFKAAATAQLMDLLMALPQIPATDEGRSIVLGGLQDVIEQALFNGTIAPSKDLTATQRAYVTQITGDELAWQTLQTNGYWVDAVVISYVATGGATEYKIDYTLLYSKADSVNKITGSHILI